jgi:hypothetical protein
MVNPIRVVAISHVVLQLVNILLHLVQFFLGWRIDVLSNDEATFVENADDAASPMMNKMGAKG